MHGFLIGAEDKTHKAVDEGDNSVTQVILLEASELVFMEREEGSDAPEREPEDETAQENLELLLVADEVDFTHYYKILYAAIRCASLARSPPRTGSAPETGSSSAPEKCTLAAL